MVAKFTVVARRARVLESGEARGNMFNKPGGPRGIRKKPSWNPFPLLKLPGVLSFERGERKEVEALMTQQGTVRWFSEEKGYGFIEPDDRGEDLFVYYTAIEGSGFRSLQEGERVIYEATQGRKGPQAQIVRKAGSPR